MIGGLLIGLIETFWSAYFTIEYKDVAVFSILVIVLIFRPYGILGKPEVEKRLMSFKKISQLLLKDLIFTGLIATVLLIPIVGFRTEISTTDSTGLIFNYNFIIAFLVVAFIVGVRFLFHIYWFSKIQENQRKTLKKK